MSTDPTPGQAEQDAGQAQAQPSEEDRSEIGQRAAYEAELSRITSADMILQAAVSLLNLGGRRLGLSPGAEGERDLEQVRDAVDGVRALLGILERSVAAQELRPLRDALAQLQMAYAREAQAGGRAEPSAQQPAAGPSAPAAAGSSGAPASTDRPATPPEQGKPAAGPAESSGRLWVPGR
jgi:hypothetical protein